MRIHTVVPFKFITFGLDFFALSILIPTSLHAIFTHSYMHTQVLSRPLVSAHISRIMPTRTCTHCSDYTTRICTHRRDNSHAHMHTWAQSCPRVYAHKGWMMPTRLCTQRLDQAQSCPHVYVHKAGSFSHVYSQKDVIITTYMHT